MSCHERQGRIFILDDGDLPPSGVIHIQSKYIQNNTVKFHVIKSTLLST